MFFFAYFLFYFGKSADECSSFSSSFMDPFDFTDSTSSCILIKESSFLSIQSQDAFVSNKQDASITFSGCLFVYCTGTFVSATNPSEILITKTAGFLPNSISIKPYVISLKTQDTSTFVTNCSAPINSEVLNLYTIENGEVDMDMINITGKYAATDINVHSDDAAIINRKNGPTEMSNIAISYIISGTKSVFRFENSGEITINSMNIYNITTWNQDGEAPFFKLINSILVMSNCYLMQIIIYNNGVLFNIDQSSVTAERTYFHLPQSGSSIGELQIGGYYESCTTEIETPSINMYKTWFMNADYPYQEGGIKTPSRTFPSDCPPLPEQKTPRSIKRIITTASALVAALQESI